MNRKLYALHRWLSLVALLQLGVWSATGLLFALLPERAVMSASVPSAHDVPLVHVGGDGLMPPAALLARIEPDARAQVHRIELRGGHDHLAYVVRGRNYAARFDAQSGEIWSVDRAEAMRIASRDQTGRPRALNARRIESDPDIEYRERPLPAWRVELDDREQTVVYVDARTGEVTARRTSTWRIYDLLWSLHIMDYGGREDFRHPLLVGAALLANATVLSGAVLWGLRLRRRVVRDRNGRSSGPPSKPP